MSETQNAAVLNWAKQNQANGLPILVLPGGEMTITDSAIKLFQLIAPSKQMFIRGGAVVNLVHRDDGTLALAVLRPSAARSAFEKFARLMAWRQGEHNQQVLKPTNCPQETAEALLLSQEALTMLPRVHGLINCPVIREVDGQPVVAGPGYDEETRLLITGGQIPPAVPLSEAVPALLALLADFEFQTPGDLARAIASMITPALKAGNFLRGRVPADVAEADQSQSGKTYRQKIIAALYKERVSLVTNRQGGVGSVDESMDQALVAGRPFIQFDNFRGRFDSSHLEAFLTAEGSFECRVPHRGSVTVPPEHYFMFLTSNGVDTTRDFANRSNIIRIRKKPPGYAFQKFPEGDLLAMVRSQQAYYLGCIFAVIRTWHAHGKLTTQETRHDNREWVQLVDWIAQHILGTAPVMEGHQQAQERVSNPFLVWLRRVLLVIAEQDSLNRPLIASEIASLCEESAIPPPGLRTGTDRDRAAKAIGSIMAKLFRDSETLELDGFTVTREEQYVSRENPAAGGNFKSKTYTVTKP